MLASDPRVPVIARLLATLAVTVYLFTAGGSLTTTDAVATFEVTRAIVEEGGVAMPGNLLGREEERGIDGRYYSPFGLGQSIYNIPFYVAAKAVTGATGLRLGKPDSLAKAFVALGVTFLVAAIVWQVFCFAVAVTGDVTASAFAALTLAFGSVLWPYAGFGFNQPLAALALLAAARHAFLGTRGSSSRHLVYAGTWMGACFMTRHELALAVLPLAGWLWLDGRPALAERTRRLAAAAPGIGLGAVVWMTYNVVRFGSPLNAGQDAGPGYGSPIVAGLLGLLASPAASVFLYSPVAAAGALGLVVLGRRDRSAAIFFAANVVLFVGFYATLGNWIGGRSYGSRYLVVVLPFFGLGWAAMLAALAPARRRIAFALVLAVGLALQLPGVLIDYAKVSQAVGALQRPFTTEERQWRWDASPLVLNTRALVRALPENAAYLLGRRPPPAIVPVSGVADRSFSQQFGFSLDVWWLYLFYLRALPAWAVGVLMAGAGAAIWWLSRRLVREMRHTRKAPGPA